MQQSISKFNEIFCDGVCSFYARSNQIYKRIKKINFVVACIEKKKNNITIIIDVEQKLSITRRTTSPLTN